MRACGVSAARVCAAMGFVLSSALVAAAGDAPVATDGLSYVVEPGAGLSSQLWAENASGRRRALELFGGEASVIATEDFDGDGDSDALIQIDPGGSCCPPTYSFVVNQGGQRYIEAPIEDVYAWAPPEIEAENADWMLRFTSENLGGETESGEAAPYERWVTIVELRDDAARTLRVIRSEPLPARIELHASDLESAGGTGGFRADLDGDGTPEQIECAYWLRWSRLTDCAALPGAGGAPIPIEESCERLGVLDETAEGHAVLVCDHDKRLVYDPASAAYRLSER